MMGGSGHAAMQAMAMAHLQKMLDQVGATAEQKARIDAILRAGMGSMMGMHQSMEDTHRQLHALLTAPTIDRDALEQLRATQIAQLDQASRTMVRAMADAAEVLTPEQRAKLGQLMKAAHPPS
jgi:Spy/CpxP family protein refolding chaperone